MNNEKEPLLRKPPTEDMKLSGVYSISTEDKSLLYVGSTVNFSNRLAGHKLDCKRDKGNRNLQEYVREHGWSNLIFSILEIVDNRDELKDRENYWISYYGFENLINVAPNAITLKGTKMPDSHREKSSKRMMGNSLNLGIKFKKEKGEKCALYWETHPEEKARMIEKNRESQKKVDRSVWEKGKIIEVSLDGVVIDKCYGKKDVMDKHPIKHTVCSKILSGAKKEYNGYSLKYIGRYFKTNTINTEVYYEK